MVNSRPLPNYNTLGIIIRNHSLYNLPLNWRRPKAWSPEGKKGTQHILRWMMCHFIAHSALHVSRARTFIHVFNALSRT